MKFLHTSDWRIGMKADSVGKIRMASDNDGLSHAKTDFAGCIRYLRVLKKTQSN